MSPAIEKATSLTLRWRVAMRTWKASLRRRTSLPLLVVEDPEEARHGRGARTDAELGVDVLEVLPHRGRRDPKDLGDLRIRLPARDPGEDLALPRAQTELV